MAQDKGKPIKFIRKNGKVIPIYGNKGGGGGGATKKKKYGSAWKPGGSSYNKSIAQSARHDRKADNKRKLFLAAPLAGAALLIPGVRADVGRAAKFIGKHGKKILRRTGA